MPANIAQVRLSIDDDGSGGGADLTDTVNPRLVELTLTEQTGDEADELAITLQNHDGLLEAPEPGKVIVLSLGWKSGDDVTVGLVAKGRFKVDEVEEGGPPDMMTIRARSADFIGDYRKRRTETWKNTTLGAVMKKIAQRNGLTAQVHADLANKPIAAIEQHGKSDMAFVKDLGSRFDAVATWKDRKLIVMPIGSATTVSGKEIPAVTLTKRDGWTWTFTRAQRDENDGAEAEWHDQASGRRKKVKAGGTKNPKRLKRTYASEAEAKQAAEAEAKKRARGGFTFEYDLAVADMALTPNGKITLSGWSTKIDAVKWLAKNVETTFDAQGLRQRLSLESLGESGK